MFISWFKAFKALNHEMDTGSTPWAPIMNFFSFFHFLYLELENGRCSSGWG